jgi:hypothetical protein
MLNYRQNMGHTVLDVFLYKLFSEIYFISEEYVCIYVAFMYGRMSKWKLK